MKLCRNAAVRFASAATLSLVLIPSMAIAGAIVPFTLTGALPAADDVSSNAVPLGLDGAAGINFFGQNFTSIYVNDNGNASFQLPLSQFSPSKLSTGVGVPVIAPFFADVDISSGTGSITYGSTTYQGRAAFAADWLNVGYFDSNTDKLNSFQLILTDRADTGAGNFDMEFNYNQIQWETGDASGGIGGHKGDSAAAGFSNGLSGASNAYYELPGSSINGALLDGGPDSLITGSLNSSTPGRYDFEVRNGQLVANTPEPASIGLLSVALVLLWARKRRYSSFKFNFTHKP